MLNQSWMTIASDTGAASSGLCQGPHYAVQNLSKKITPKNITHVFDPKRELHWNSSMSAQDKLALWLETSRAQVDLVARNFEAADRVAFFSAEHSLAYGNLAGLRARFPKSRIGVVWIDAHADLHSPGTSPTLNPHGMPLAAAMNLDHSYLWQRDLDFQTYDLWKDLQSLMMSQPILPEDLVYVGLRDLEAQETQVILEKKIKVISVKEVRNTTATRILKSVASQLDQCDLIYVSFDVDVLDAVEFSATGLPVNDGLRLYEVHDLLRELMQDPRVNAFEMTELHPNLGTDFQRRLVLQSVADLLRNWESNRQLPERVKVAKSRIEFDSQPTEAHPS